MLHEAEVWEWRDENADIVCEGHILSIESEAGLVACFGNVNLFCGVATCVNSNS